MFLASQTTYTVQYSYLHARAQAPDAWPPHLHNITVQLHVFWAKTSCAHEGSFRQKNIFLTLGFGWPVDFIFPRWITTEKPKGYLSHSYTELLNHRVGAYSVHCNCLCTVHTFCTQKSSPRCFTFLLRFGLLLACGLQHIQKTQLPFFPQFSHQLQDKFHGNRGIFNNSTLLVNQIVKIKTRNQ